MYKMKNTKSSSRYEDRLKASRKAGVPMVYIGTNGAPWRTKISQLIFEPQGAPMKLLSDLPIL